METRINSLFSKEFHEFSTNDIKIINQVIEQLNDGTIRVAQKNKHSWEVREWIKKAILLYFIVSNNTEISNAPDNSFWFDKIPNKFKLWKNKDFKDHKIRCTPLSYTRFGAYIAPKVILMPSFVNIGAYIDTNTMIDSWVTIGSCAQIGKNCHISADVCIGGVLEPLQATPVIIEDNCFIGSGSKILEGVIVEEGSIIAAGNTISASTKIIDRNTNKIYYGKIPKGSVVVPGSINSTDNLSINCSVIIKKVDTKSKNKTSINDLIRD